MHLNDALNTLIFFIMLTIQKFNVTGKLKATTKTIFVFSNKKQAKVKFKCQCKNCILPIIYPITMKVHPI